MCPVEGRRARKIAGQRRNGSAKSARRHRAGRGDATRSDESAASLSAGAVLLLAALFAGTALIVYEPALSGPFLSDDHHYVERNRYVHEVSAENVFAIFDPFGEATIEIVNYAPVQLFVHTLAWEAFGSDTRGHHVVNVAFHCLASLLLVLLLARSGIPLEAALFGGAFFLVHPANVEAVAWISQLKTSSAMVLSLLSLLAMPRRPALATALFVSALLAKATAAFVLPVVALFAWGRREAIPWRWLASWAAVFALFSVAEFSVHQRAGAAEAVLYETPFVLLRTMMALAMRYLVMAATSWGVSAFHEPEPSASLLDPWWLTSIVALGLLGWRSVVAARRRDAELAYWVWALVSFGPVSQIFPFLYPLADRYLYFILPGLLGATLLAGAGVVHRLFAQLAARFADSARVRVNLSRALGGLAAVVLVVLALHAHGRAAIWRSASMLVIDAAAHYPDGVSAHLRRAEKAAQQGDPDGAAAALRAIHARGFKQFDMLLRDPGLAPVRGDPKFQEVIREMAMSWIETIATREQPSQGELRMLARAHSVRDEYAESEAALRRALAIGGRLDAQLRIDLQHLAERDH